MTGFSWSWSFALEILPELLSGLRFTMAATFLGSAIAFTVGLFWAVLRLARVPVASQAGRAMVEFLRGTPLLIQIFFLFYVLPGYGVTLPALVVGALGLGLYYSAYASEVYRAGIEGVPRGQWEASLVVGFSLPRMWLRVVLPQAMRFAVPVLGNFVISMFKESAILSTITVMEVMAEANTIGANTARFIEPYTMAALIFFVVSYPSARLIKALEVRLR